MKTVDGVECIMQGIVNEGGISNTVTVQCIKWKPIATWKAEKHIQKCQTLWCALETCRNAPHVLYVFLKDAAFDLGQTRSF